MNKIIEEKCDAIKQKIFQTTKEEKVEKGQSKNENTNKREALESQPKQDPNQMKIFF